MRIAAFLSATACLLLSRNAPGETQRLITAKFPVTTVETSKPGGLALGASALEVNLDKADLELIVWKVDSSYALEANIDVSQVNQAVLPTDASGKILSKATALSAVPWIKVYLPGQAPKVLDVTCASRTRVCQGVWKSFPYDAQREKMLKIEANLRGLEGRIWSPVLDAHRPLTTSQSELGLRSGTLDPPYKARKGSSGASVRVTAVYDLLRMPSEFSKLKLLSVYEWNFLNDEKLRETGFVKTLHKTLFQVDRGRFLLDTIAQSTLQTQELLDGWAFVAEPGTAMSLSSRKTAESPESSLRALEFE